MDLSENSKSCLQFFKDIFEVSNICSTKTFIWGGTTIDILEGEFIREHHDIDGFTLNLLDVRDEMTTEFQNRGYETSYMEEVDILGIKKGDLHAGFNRLETDGDTAMWRGAGDEGTLFFPLKWLDNEPRIFYDTKVYISGIEFEYAIKTNPKMLHPKWEPREKDLKAIESLSKLLEERNIDKIEILKNVWSYNPYWSKRGYSEYSMPVVAWQLNPL